MSDRNRMPPKAICENCQSGGKLAKLFCKIWVTGLAFAFCKWAWQVMGRQKPETLSEFPKSLPEFSNALSEFPNALSEFRKSRYLLSKLRLSFSILFESLDDHIAKVQLKYIQHKFYYFGHDHH